MACWGPTAQQAIQFCAAKGGAGGRGLECAVREVISAEVERGVDRKHRGHVVAKEETGELEAVITLLIQLLQVRPFLFRLMKTPKCDQQLLQYYALPAWLAKNPASGGAVFSP
jgi:hypothetical protein